MALILQIETSTISCSVALAENGATIACKEASERNIHASSITLFIEEVMKSAGKGLSDLDAVAVSKGPGSYTGLRIGVSTAKGLCYALDVPLIAIDTLKAMASNREVNSGNAASLLCPMIDARRMEVYTAVYDNVLNEIIPVSAKIIDENSFADLLDSRKMLFFGDGAGKCMEILGRKANASFITTFENSASDMSEEAFKRFNQQLFEDIAYFEPYYLKDFVATTPKVI
ncbi:tRNA (adenosine(37)-N6)-threonylcarbamoyltransferase complex dimerization subunit type 1 TsaB [Arcticibacter sp.]|uniref:tRNA (adenosine(37)-N6)-threonylcarbamoyltransferase complex dimerization subunit type 1 TsaB n=1 Tax=Arcticibacter sp. TaxID=1872630 RepID=UPI00388FAEFE